MVDYGWTEDEWDQDESGSSDERKAGQKKTT
jgi:hypothetical protein